MSSSDTSTAPEAFGDFWSVIPAGGAGTRLWPLSRARSPKFLHDLTGRGRSLLQATADRLAPLSGDRLVVVTGVAHEEAVRAQLPDLAADRLLAEPSPRDSMAAIGLAAALIERIDPEAVIGSFAADHVVGAERDFREAVREAVAFGFGIGVVFAAEFRPEAGLKRIVITGADFDVGEYIVCRAERQRLPLVRSFFEMVQDVIETR